MGGGPRWTGRQEKRLRKLYPQYPRCYIENEIPHSWKAIRTRAHALGIARRRAHRDWMEIVRRHRPTFRFADESVRN